MCFGIRVIQIFSCQFLVSAGFEMCIRDSFQTEDSAAASPFMKLFCRLFNSNTSSRYFSAKPSGLLFLFHCKAFPAAVILNTDIFLLIYCIFFKLLLCSRDPGDLDCSGSVAVCQTVKRISGHHKTGSIRARYAKHVVSTLCKLAARCVVLSPICG